MLIVVFSDTIFFWNKKKEDREWLIKKQSELKFVVGIF